jgi:hypothetical protein
MHFQVQIKGRDSKDAPKYQLDPNLNSSWYAEGNAAESGEIYPDYQKGLARVRAFSAE